MARGRADNLARFRHLQVFFPTPVSVVRLRTPHFSNTSPGPAFGLLSLVFDSGSGHTWMMPVSKCTPAGSWHRSSLQAQGSLIKKERKKKSAIDVADQPQQPMNRSVFPNRVGFWNSSTAPTICFLCLSCGLTLCHRPMMPHHLGRLPHSECKRPRVCPPVPTGV